MKNEEIAKILFEIGDYLDMEEVPFKPKAYQTAAISLDNLEKDVFEIYKEEGLKGIEEIEGVGESIALKIEEYLKTGRIKYFEKLKKESPIDLETLLKIEGLGHKRIKFLYKELGIKNLKQLQRAIDDKKIEGLKGFGEKTQRNIKEGIKFLKEHTGRFLMSEIEDDVKNICINLKKNPETKQIAVAGSYRRRKETVGDIDILITSSFPAKIMTNFVSMPEAVKIWAKGPTKSSIRLQKGCDADLRIVEAGSFGAALQYFTGSKEHNVALRKIALKKGYKLNEYGLFKGNLKVAGKNEEGIYKKLGLEYIEPELRENSGEIKAAQKGALPKLIELKNIKGDMHCHTNWTDGENSIEEVVQRAISLKYEYVGITDHTQDLKLENGLNERRLEKQAQEIRKLNKKYGKFKIFHGAEVNILKNGKLDIKNSTLKELDFVSISVHSHLKMKEKEMTERVLLAMSNPYVKLLNHPTGRIVNKRPKSAIDLEKIFEFAIKRNIAMEINSSHRMDLCDIDIRRAKEKGCKFFINTDEHSIKQMERIKYGVYQARRGWLEKKDVINSMTLKKISEFLKR